MQILSNYKSEWIIGLTCALIPSVLGFIVKSTFNIPDIMVPFWLVCILVAIIPVYYIPRYFSKKTKVIANKYFGVARVIIDGKHFTNCTFDGSELVFLGKLPFSFSKNNLTGIRMKFEGSSALTAESLAAMYRSRIQTDN